MRAADAKRSIIRDILKVTQRPQVISFAGALPSPATFPVDALREALGAVLQAAGRAALQYSATEGDDALRAWAAARETAKGIPTSPEQVLIAAGSQQGLDLIGNALIDAGGTVLLESPADLGGLQDFALFQPKFRELPVDAEGLQPAGVDATRLLDAAIVRNVALVPGAAFYANAPRANTLRLSFVTVPPGRIRAGVAILGELLREPAADAVKA